MQGDTIKTNVANTYTPVKEEGNVTNQAQTLQPPEHVAIGGGSLIIGLGLMLFNWLMVLVTNRYFETMSFIGPCLVCIGVAMMIPVGKAGKETRAKTEEQPIKNNLFTHLGSCSSSLGVGSVFFLALSS